MSCKAGCTAIILWLFSVALLLACVCAVLDPIAGGGTDIANARVYGFVVTEDGMPAKNTQVTIVPASYNPLRPPPLPPSLTVTTDINGMYVFPNVDTGRYLGTMVQLSTRTMALSAVFNAICHDTTIVPLATLHKPSTIKIGLPGDADTASGAFYIPGTTLSTAIKNTGKPFAILDSVPVGTLPSLNYCVIGGAVDRVIRYDVQVLPGDTTYLLMPAWKYSTKLHLNTTSAGADVAGTVTGFPTLIRLTSINFDFTRARANGEDLRFTKSDNTILPYEIEHWDAVGQQAEIWVKVDTIFGNDSSRFIMMYSGNSEAADASNGAAVFDTSNGSLGAWHLDNNCNDAAIGRHNGTNFGAIDTVGIIGNCKKFRGNDSIKIDGLMGNPACVTLSAWASLDTVTYISGSEVVSIGNAVLIRMDDDYQTRGTQGAFSISGDTLTDCIGTGLFFAKTGWHYLTYTYDCNALRQTFYIDGVPYGVHTNANPINYATVGNATYIGIHGHGENVHNFIGLIDEVRICNVSRAADWVKLCYMNQRTDDHLVVFK